MYVRTEVGTDFPEASPLAARLRRLLSWIVSDGVPRSYRGNLHRVATWLIEFDEAGEAICEVGLSTEGEPILRSDGLLGFWVDGSAGPLDLAGETISREEFLAAWRAASSDG